MSLPFLLLWLFIAVSVLGTGALWKIVRKVSRDGWTSLKRPPRENEDKWRSQQEEQRQRLELAAREASTAKRRRDDARAKCELLFTVYAPEIGSRFSREMLHAFIRNYMTDDRPPEEVEERARQLEEILNQHRSAVRPAPRFRNIEELANWYVSEKRRIETLPVDDIFKEQHLVQLHTAYAELTQQVMEQRQ